MCYKEMRWLGMQHKCTVPDYLENELWVAVRCCLWFSFPYSFWFLVLTAAWFQLSVPCCSSPLVH